MYDVRQFGGSDKGLIGECLFKLVHKYAVLAPLANPASYFEKRPYVLPFATLKFLRENWNCIDAFEVLLAPDMSIRHVNLYEIKTHNQYRDPRILRHPRPAVSYQVDAMLRAAPSSGISPYVAEVVLHGDWNFDITIVPYADAEVYVCPRPNYAERRAATKWAPDGGSAPPGLSRSDSPGRI